MNAPKLRIVSQQPLTVRGEMFRPRERIVVTALTLTGPKRVLVQSTSSGRFRATFRRANQPCGKPFAIRAFGALGSYATVTVPSRACVPPPID